MCTFIYAMIFSPYLSGLTEAEIDAAVSRAESTPPPSNGQNPPQLPPRPLTPPHHRPQPRTWSEYAVMAAVVGGVGFALAHFFRVSFLRIEGGCAIQWSL